MEGLQQQRATVVKGNHALKEPYSTDFLTVHRLKIKLREEAKALWQLKTEEKQLIKRWFRKSEENHIEKDQFITCFVDANLEKSLKTEKYD